MTAATAGAAAAARADPAGDFDAIFLAHYGEVYRLLYRITGSAEESEDLAQETFLRLHRQRFDRGREHNLRAWLLRVATNLAYNAIRGRERSRQRDIDASVRLWAGAELPDDPASRVERAGGVATVRRALAKLPPRQARLLLLRYSDLSYREVAEALGVAAASVGTLLARAEAAFEAELDRLELEERE